MKSRKLLSDISASAIARIASQVISFTYFFLIAIWMSRSELGVYSFCLASGQFTALILTCGTNPIITRRIAGQMAPLPSIAGAAMFQRLVFPLILGVILLPVVLIFSNQLKHPYLILLAFGISSFGFLSISLRQVIVAKQFFWWATVLELAGLITKVVVGLTLIILKMSVLGLFIALCAGSVVEFVLSLIVIRRQIGLWLLPKLQLGEMWASIKEGLPLLAALVFSQALARFDWILMGVLRTEAETGEYAFAYRLFEISWLPHAIIGTLLLPKFSKAFQKEIIPIEQKRRLSSLHCLMVAVGVVFPLMMVSGWTPVVDWLTQGKYGAVNESVVRILVLAAPFAAGTGMLWNLAVSRGKTKGIMVISMLTCVMNIVGNIILIPRLGAVGAATVLTIPLILQYFGYLFLMRNTMLWACSLWGIMVSTTFGILAFFVASVLAPSWPLQILIALGLYVFPVYLANGANRKDLDIVLRRGGYSEETG